MIHVLGIYQRTFNFYILMPKIWIKMKFFGFFQIIKFCIFGIIFQLFSSCASSSAIISLAVSFLCPTSPISSLFHFKSFFKARCFWARMNLGVP